MKGGLPLEMDLRRRITDQLDRSRSDLAALLWKGYLAGLFEWGLIEFDAYSRLTDILPDIGSKDLAELFADEPISQEELREIERKKNDGNSKR